MALRKRESKLFDRIKKNIKNVHFTISSPLAELLKTLQSNMRP
jgi:hypothetical protein